VDVPVRALLAVTLSGWLAGCAVARTAPLDEPPHRDLAVDAAADFASADLASADLASADLARVDLAAPVDLAHVDLAAPSDLARPPDLIAPPDLATPPDPCAFAASGNGAYCGQSLPGGTSGWLYSCTSGVTTNKTHCPTSCKQNPPGTPDYCA
jgi:hypothetical protein